MLLSKKVTRVKLKIGAHVAVTIQAKSNFRAVAATVKKNWFLYTALIKGKAHMAPHDQAARLQLERVRLTLRIPAASLDMKITLNAKFFSS